MDKLVIPAQVSYGVVTPFLLDKATAIADASEDFIFRRPSDVRMFMPMVDNLSFYQGNLRQFTLSDFALAQLCGKLGMPSQYYKLLSQSKDEAKKSLAKTNINTLLDRYDKSFFVRTTSRNVRGILSDKYTTFDTNEIIDVFQDVVESVFTPDLNQDNIQFRGYSITPDRFHMRFTTNTPLLGVKDKDLFAGLQVDSSDVGRSKLCVRFFLYKQVCSNGLCIPVFNSELYSQRHIGIGKDEFEQGLRRSFVNFPIVAEKASALIKEAGEATLNHKVFCLEENPALQKALQTVLRVDEKTLDDIIALAGTYSPTVWGLVNAVTQKAQAFDVERRIELETMAGNLLTGYSRLGIA